MSSLPAAAKGFVVAAFGHNWVGPRPASFDHVQCTAVFSGKFMKRGVFVCEPTYVLYAVTYVLLDSSLVRIYVRTCKHTGPSINVWCKHGHIFDHAGIEMVVIQNPCPFLPSLMCQLCSLLVCCLGKVSTISGGGVVTRLQR